MEKLECENAIKQQIKSHWKQWLLELKQTILNCISELSWESFEEMKQVKTRVEEALKNFNN